MRAQDVVPHTTRLRALILAALLLRLRPWFLPATCVLLVPQRTPQAFVPCVEWQTGADVLSQIAHFSVVGEVRALAAVACRACSPRVMRRMTQHH